MNTLDQRRLAYHGSLIFVLSLVSGTVFMLLLIFHAGDDLLRAWGAAHRAPLVMAVWMIAVSAIMPNLILTQRASRLIASTLVSGIYMITVAVNLAAILKVRGLFGWGTEPMNLLTSAVNAVGGVVALFGAVLVLIGAHNALRGLRPDQPK